MKTKNIIFKHKKQKHEIKVIVFETLAQAHNVLGDEILKVLNFGNEELARLREIGVDPFKAKKTKFKLDATKLDEETIARLREAGAIS